jgi:hypothetical protein
MQQTRVTVCSVLSPRSIEHFRPFPRECCMKCYKSATVFDVDSEDAPWWKSGDPVPYRDPKDYRITWDPLSHEMPRLSSGGWVKVSGGGLNQSIYARIALKGGRPRVIGLLVDNDLEVTADLLRSIRVGALLEQFIGDFDESGPRLSGVKFKYHQIVKDEWDLMRHFLAEAKPAAADSPPPIRARKGQPPSDEALRRFANVYRHSLAANPRGAITQTAREMHMARSTVYRWIDLCRDRGLLEKES